MSGEKWECEGATRQALKTLIRLRLLMVSVILGMGIFVLHGHTETPLGPFYTMLGVTVLLSAVYWLGVQRGKNFQFQAVVQLIVDVGLATGVVHYTGAFSSPFSLLYILIIAAGSRFLFLRGTVLLALFCAAAHGTHLGYILAMDGSKVLDSGGLLPPVGWTSEAIRLLALQVGLYTVTFLFLAVLAGYFSVQVRRRGMALDAVRTRLRRAHLNTDQILRSLSSGLLTIDGTGRIVHFNRAAEEITGLHAADVVGTNFRRVFQERAPAVVSLLGGILSGWKNVTRKEIAYTSREGSVVPVGMSASPLRDEEGGNAGVVAIFQDLTEVRKMEEQIRHADRLAAVGELSAGIAHEIRNPLATISGSIQVLQSDLPVDGENSRLLDLVVRESDRLHTIVEEFLDFARTGPIDRRPVELSVLLREVADLPPGHPKRGMKQAIRVKTGDNDPLVLVDEEQMRRVFLNIRDNALEAMGEGGELEVELRLVDSFRSSPDSYPTQALAVSFKDTGPGIRTEERDLLFRPFYTTKKGGVGLGLAIVQKIVMSHNGKIAIEEEGSGATFVVYIPWDGKSVDRHEGATAPSAGGGLLAAKKGR